MRYTGPWCALEVRKKLFLNFFQRKKKVKRKFISLSPYGRKFRARNMRLFFVIIAALRIHWVMAQATTGVGESMMGYAPVLNATENNTLLYS